MKRQTGTMLIEDMGLKVGERFKVGRYTMVYAGVIRKGRKVYDEIVPLAVWKREHESN